jgi:hypothetical protein
LRRISHPSPSASRPSERTARWSKCFLTPAFRSSVTGTCPDLAIFSFSSVEETEFTVSIHVDITKNKIIYVGICRYSLLANLVYVILKRMN